MGIRRLLVVFAVVTAVAVATVAAPAAGRTIAVRAGCSWKAIPVSGGFQLHSISAESGSDIWAVGNANAVGKPFALHYNGSSWKPFTLPTKGAGTIDLYDVEAFSNANAWAVGYYDDSHGNSRTLTEHWDGHAWKIVPSPNRGSGDNTLHGVAAVSGSHLWAVGYTGPTPGEGPLIEHWNGSSWSLVPPGGLGGIPSILDDVSVISKDNVVAVGHRDITPGGTLVERFSGSSWKAEVSANPPIQAGSELWAVSTPSAGAQWAVGESTNQQGTPRTLAERNLGGGWVLKTPLNVGTAPNELKGVSALSAGKAFAVGNYKTSAGTRRALAERFANGSWTTFKPPNATPFDNELESLAAISATNVWAVGSAAKDAFGFSLKPLIEHFSC